MWGILRFSDLTTQFVITLTFNRVIWRQIPRTSRIPWTLMPIASLSFSSNRTVAAAWKTMLTLLIRVCRSVRVRPSPGREQSPGMATILCRNLGTSARSWLNTCRRVGILVTITWDYVIIRVTHGIIVYLFDACVNIFALFRPTQYVNVLDVWTRAQ